MYLSKASSARHMEVRTRATSRIYEIRCEELVRHQRKLLDFQVLSNQHEEASTMRMFSELIGPTGIGRLLRKIGKEGGLQCWKNFSSDRQKGLLTLDILRKGLTKERKDCRQASIEALASMVDTKY